MKWKTNRQIMDGDKRTIIRFAFLPTPMSDGMTIWLERYLLHQVFVCLDDGAGWATIVRYAVVQ